MRNDDPPKPKVNLVEGDDVIATVISQVNMVTSITRWAVDSGATRHMCADKNVYTSYKLVGEEEELVYMGDSKTPQVHGIGKVLLKLTSGKTLALTEVLHVPTIRVNLISVSLLNKKGIRISFEFDKITMTKRI